MTLFSPASLQESESDFSTNEQAVMNNCLIEIFHFRGLGKSSFKLNSLFQPGQGLQGCPGRQYSTSA